MSLLTMGAVGVGRDFAARRQSLGKDLRAARTAPITQAPPAQGGVVAPAGAADSTAAGGGVASFGQLLVAQIPSEALLAYTTLLALFSAGGSTYRAGRWGVYAAAIVVCAAVVLSSYFAQRDYDFADASLARRPRATWRGLHLPILPTVSAMAAMAVYGLTVPGSPLQAELSGTAFAIWSGCLAVTGGVMMAIFAPFLSKGNAAQPVPRQP